MYMTHVPVYQYQVWSAMLVRSAKTHLGGVTIPFLNSWLGMMMMPACAPIDHTALVQALHRTQNKVQYTVVMYTKY